MTAKTTRLRQVRTPASDAQSPSEGHSGETAGKSLGERLVLGFVGGLVATLSMTVFRMPTSKSLPPTAAFWSKFVGSDEPEDYPLIGLLLHFLYGAISGAIFAAVAPGSDDSEALAESKAASTGTLYGVGLSVFGSQIVLERILGLDLETDERLVFHISHVVYGLTLGTWVGSRLAAEQGEN